MEVLRFIKVYRCKAPELPRFAWMHERSIYKVLHVFFAKIPECEVVNVLDSDLIMLILCLSRFV